MGVVTEHLKALVRKQVADHGIVVWYDPGGQLADVAREMTIDGGRVVLYEGSFLALRRSVDDLLEGADDPPQLLVHVPLDPWVTPPS